MMQIHTTQNLTTLGTTIQPTNVVSSKDFRFNFTQGNNFSQYSTSPSFRGKKPSKDALNKFTKKVVEESKKVVGDIKKDANVEKKTGDKFLDSKAFDWMLGIADHEPLVQSIISFVVCMLFRPLSIMAISNDKTKQDNEYAAAHSMASGATGIIATLLLTNPFKGGEGYAMKTLLKDMKTPVLERMFPHLDINSIKGADGNRKLVTEWLDKSGNKFITGLKDVSKIAEFKQFADVSEETFKYLGADVDWAAMKGKSFNDVVTKDGKSLYEAIDWTKVGIKLNDKGADGQLSILCKNLDRGFLEALIKDAEDGSRWKNLDIKSVYDESGLVKDFRNWKSTNGEQWKLDLDSSYISSALETADYIPEISGKVRRVSGKTGENKYTCYLKNGKDGRLGTEITQKMHDADASSDVQKKLLTWIPDIISRPFVATGTIALIPWMLKNVFNIEKSKKPQDEKVEFNTSKDAVDVNKQNIKNADKSQNTQTTFKGKEDSIIRKFLGKYYGKPMYESSKIRTAAEKLSKWFGEDMTQHFATLGATVTSGVYMMRTINNKELDKDRRKTLALNQFLCLVIPTICAYTVDRLLRDFTKKVEYRYDGRREHEIAKLLSTGAEADAKKANEITKKLCHNLRGVRIISGLATFTLIYRYITPVLITPLANKLSDYLQNRKKVKAEALAKQQSDSKTFRTAT